MPIHTNEIVVVSLHVYIKQNLGYTQDAFNRPLAFRENLGTSWPKTSSSINMPFNMHANEPAQVAK